MDLASQRAHVESLREEVRAYEEKSNTDDGLTQDEVTAWNGKLDELESAQESLKQLESAHQRALSARNAAPTSPGRVSPRDSHVPAQSHAQIVADEIERDPKRGYTDSKAFLLDVKDACTGRAGSIRNEAGLNWLSAAAGSDEHSRFNDQSMGYTVPRGFLPEMRMLEPEANPLRGRVTAIPMTAPVVDMAAKVDKDHSDSVTGGLRVYRRAEAATVDASRIQTEMITLKAHELMGVSYATEELLRDSPISLAALIQASFGEEFESRIFEEMLYGTHNGEYQGILDSSNKALITVDKEGSQTADTIEYANLVKMRSRCWRYGSAIWLASHAALPQLMTLADDNNQLIMTESAREDIGSRLMGRPLIFTEYLQPVGDKGDILLVNPSEYLEGTRQSTEAAESIHVRFLENERTWRFTMSNDGATWWTSALKPKKHTSHTMSPFVTLQARD